MWSSMVGRCNNPASHGYSKYGAKGVTICPEWEDPYLFMGWALLNGYKEGLTIERLDVHKGYCPSNCTWIPGANQYINRRLLTNNTSGFTGVSYDKNTNKWVARVRHNKKRKQLGRYASAELANQARLQYFFDNDMHDEIKAHDLQQKNKEHLN